MPGATLLMLAGIWVIAQVTLGNALGRLGITGDPDHTPPVDPVTHLPGVTRPPSSDLNGHPF